MGEDKNQKLGVGFSFATVKEIAQLLRCSARTIRRWIADEQIPATNVTGRWLFPTELILNVWVHDRERALAFWTEHPHRFLQEIDQKNDAADENQATIEKLPETDAETTQACQRILHVLGKKRNVL